MTPSRFAASAVRSSAPIFPGFSGASATSRSGVLLICSLNKLKSCCLASTIASTPSVLARYASFSYTCLLISIGSTSAGSCCSRGAILEFHSVQ